MKFVKNNQKFKWIGEGVQVQRRADRLRYQAFSIGDLEVRIGDYVLVRNDDALDPEDIMSCYVAQVKDLFDTGDEYDPYQAEVQWFSRTVELPAYAIKSLKTVGHEYEIVQDKRSSWHNMIDAETIFQKCVVLFLSTNDDCEAVLSKYTDHPFPVFFCRYAFTGLCLVLVKDTNSYINKWQKSVTEKSALANGFVFQSDTKVENNKSPEKSALTNGFVLQSDKKVENNETPEKSVLTNSFVLQSDKVGNNATPEKSALTNGFVLQCGKENNMTPEKSTRTNGFVPQSDKEVENNMIPEKRKPSNKTKNMYCAIPTGSPQYPKVLIKKIDDKILECRKGNVRIFVADPNSGKVEDFSNLFLDKIKLKKQQPNEHLEKKPIIHSLSYQNIIPSEKLCDSKAKSNDSSVESENVKTPKRLISRKNSTPLSNKPCKNLFSCSTQNSEIYSTPEKKAKVVPVDDIAEKFSSKLKFDKDFECNGGMEKESLTYSLRSQNNNKELKFEKNSECEAKSQTPKSRRSCLSKTATTPLSNKSCKKKIDTNLKSSTNKCVAVENSDACTTPKKKAKFTDVINDFRLTRSGRRIKTVNYAENIMEIVTTATPVKKKTPRFVRNDISDCSDSDNFSPDEDSSDDSSMSEVSILEKISPNKKKVSLKKNKRKTSSKKNDMSTQVSSSKKKVDLCIPERKTPLRTPKNALEESRQRLHVSAVPNSLPCREEEYSDIYSFVKGCLCAQTGGCMYISGVPGTGKTATVHEVIRNLEEEKESGEVPIFTFVEVNGMWMIDPYQCYVQILKALTGESIAPQQAADLLEKRFTERGPKKDAVVLLVDELDRLWTRKQTVMYNIFDWPSKKYSKLIVLAIANTMDLPERMMMNRISSRLGLTRKTFHPYTFRQLQEIVMSRIQDLKVFEPDAVQLVARKVAAVSGDARRALDICRFATETVKVGQTPKRSQKVLVGMEHVDLALQQMFSSPVISAIRSSSKITKLFLQCLLSEFTRSGLEETTLLKVHRQVVSTCRFEGFHLPNSTEIFRICSDLAALHLILIDNFRNDLYMKIRLNVSSDDVTYALTLK